MSNMKKFYFILMIAFFATMVQSCYNAPTDADEEIVLVKKPWIFGHGGVDDTPITSGATWCAITTDTVKFKICPVRYTEVFDDIFSNNNTPLDFNSYITIQIQSGHTPVLLKNYGKSWYANNIQVPYRNYTREEVSKYSPFDLVSNRDVLNKIDSAVMSKMTKYVEHLSKEKEFPIIIKAVVTGAAKPNKDQLTEMNRTAALIQKKESEQRNKEMEIVRAEAETARAQADKAYQNAMGLSSEQFIQLKYIEMIDKKQGANIDVMIGGANPMWNVRR